MNRRTRVTNMPPGFISKHDYPIGQIGGNAQFKLPGINPGFVSKYNYPIGQMGGCSQDQAGGFAFIPAIAAAYGALKAVQPFSKGKKALEDNIPIDRQNNIPYKIAHKIASIGASLGFGEVAITNPVRYQKSITQPILANISKTKLSRKKGKKIAKKFNAVNKNIKLKKKQKKKINHI